MFVFGKPLQPSIMFAVKVVALPTNIKLGWKGLPGTSTSLLQKSVNYGCKKFYSTGPRTLKLFTPVIEDYTLLRSSDSPQRAALKR
jgi:hypothetical protein